MHRSQAKQHDGRRGASFASLLVPFVLCAFCPACLAVWGPLLGSLGLGFALPEVVHPVALGLAVLIALGPAAVRGYRTGTWRPFLFVIGGTAILLATHAIGAGRLLEALGAIGLLLGSVLESRAIRRLSRGGGAFT